jgi:hypothetical protein
MQRQKGWIKGVLLGLAGVVLSSATSATHASIGMQERSLSTAKTPHLSTVQVAAVQRAKASNPIRPPTQCPGQLESLIPLMLRDLPSYANRVNQRVYSNYRTPETPGYVILAGRPEFTPLSLGPGEYRPTTQDQPPQVFFTTLERQYLKGKSVSLQHYHWLFLTQTRKGWQLIMMFSALGDNPPDQPPTPPQDSSQGVIAQAVRLWLRDCTAGSIAPP